MYFCKFVLRRKNTDTFQCQMVIINQICSWMCLDEETFCLWLMELMELELSLPRPSSVTISSTIFEKELVLFQFHQNCNQFPNLELLVPLHNTTDSFHPTPHGGAGSSDELNFNHTFLDSLILITGSHIHSKKQPSNPISIYRARCGAHIIFYIQR